MRRWLRIILSTIIKHKKNTCNDLILKVGLFVYIQYPIKKVFRPIVGVQYAKNKVFCLIVGVQKGIKKVFRLIVGVQNAKNKVSCPIVGVQNHEIKL